MTSSASPVHHLGEIERLLGGRLAIVAERQQSLGVDDDGIEPLSLTEALCPEHHSNIGPVDLGSYFADMILRDSVCIRRIGRHLQYSHSTLPDCCHSGPPGNICNHTHRFQSDKYVHQYSYGVCSSFYLNACSQNGEFARFGCADIPAHERSFQ